MAGSTKAASLKAAALRTCGAEPPCVLQTFPPLIADCLQRFPLCLLFAVHWAMWYYAAMRFYLNNATMRSPPNSRANIPQKNIISPILPTLGFCEKAIMSNPAIRTTRSSPMVMQEC